MKIAVLADIHSNYIAFEKVLEDIDEKHKPESYYFLGDYIGYYFWPKQVVDMVEAIPNKEMVQGNHERMLEEKQKGSNLQSKYGKGIEIAEETLSSKQQKLLIDLPEKRMVNIDGVRILLCHGSPQDRDLYVYPDSSDKLLYQCADNEADIVLMAHTHYPFVKRIGGKVLANAGSVGQPRDKGSLSSYLIVDTDTKEVIIQRVKTDNLEVIKKAKEIHPNLPYLQEVLMRGIED